MSGGATADGTVAAAVREATAAISRSRSIDHWKPVMSRYDAEELMAAVLGDPLTPARRRDHLDAARRRRYSAMVARRVAGEPVAQIIGTIQFRGLELRVRPGVFGPRPSSEFLAEEAIRELRRRRRSRIAVDVATGAGPVAIALADAVRNSEVWGIDVSPAAVRLCRENARRANVRNVTFRVSDMLDGLPSRLRGAVDVFTIHPPYVGRGELRVLPREIRDFEPLHSLTDGSDDGLGLVRRLAADAPAWLAPGGTVLIEIGTYLARPAATILRQAGFERVRSARDSLGVTRIVSGHGAR